MKINKLLLKHSDIRMFMSKRSNEIITFNEIKENFREDEEFLKTDNDIYSEDFTKENWDEFLNVFQDHIENHNAFIKQYKKSNGEVAYMYKTFKGNINNYKHIINSEELKKLNA